MERVGGVKIGNNLSELLRRWLNTLFEWVCSKVAKSPIIPFIIAAIK